MTTALERLASFYNGATYNPSTNAGGFPQGGHIVNFIPALQDVASVATDVASNATAAAASASAASSSATAAASSAAALSGTSTTSLAIGNGSKAFTTQSGKSFAAGTWLNIRSAANPTTNYMIGQVSSYSGAALVVSVPANGVGGSGTFADWVITVAGSVGQQGTPGNTGPQGASPAIQWNFSNGTSDSDPGNGLFKFNSATTSSVTFIYLDNLNRDNIDVTAWIDALDDSTNPTDRGRLFIIQPDTPSKFVTFKVTGAVTDGSGYRKVPVTYIASSAPAAVPFTDASAIAIDFSPTSNRGADGAGSGDVVGPSGATDNAIPLFNTTTGKLIKDSGVGIGTAGANVGRLDGNNTYSGTSAFSGAVTWTSTKIGTVANANALTVGPNGATNPTLKVDTSTAAAATGLLLKSAAAAAGFALSVLSSGVNEALAIDAKGSGGITIGGTSTGAISLARNTSVTGTLGVSGDVAINTNKFTIAAASGNTAVAGTLGVTGAASFNDTTASTSTTTGAVKVSGGLGVAGDAYVGATLNVASTLNVNSNLMNLGVGSTGSNVPILWINGGSGANGGSAVIFYKNSDSTTRWDIGHHSIAAGGSASSDFVLRNPGVTNTFAYRVAIANNVTTFQPQIAPAAGGEARSAILFSSTTGLGLYWGGGAPTVPAAKGSIYIRTDGAQNARLYINNDGGTGWSTFNTLT